jgi:hypothetical protein
MWPACHVAGRCEICETNWMASRTNEEAPNYETALLVRATGKPRSFVAAVPLRPQKGSFFLLSLFFSVLVLPSLSAFIW